MQADDDYFLFAEIIQHFFLFNGVKIFSQIKLIQKTIIIEHILKRRQPIWPQTQSRHAIGLIAFERQ